VVVEFLRIIERAGQEFTSKKLESLHKRIYSSSSIIFRNWSLF